MTTMSAPATYDLGDSIRLTYELVDQQGQPVHATVTCVITKPDGSTLHPVPSPVATGIYEVTIVADLAGLWRWAFTASDTVTDHEDGWLVVEPAVRPDLYVTPQEVREQLGDDAGRLPVGLLERACRAASRAIDAHCGRKFWLDPVPTYRYYRPQDPYQIRVEDIGSTQGLVIQTDPRGDGSWSVTWSADDYELGTLNADAHGGAYAWTSLTAVGAHTLPVLVIDGELRRSRRATLRVLGRHGYSQTPDDIRMASLLKAVALFKRKDAPLGIAGFGEFGPVRVTRKDHDVLDLLAPHVRATTTGW